MACDCNKRPIIDALGKSVKTYHEALTPYYGGATAAGKTILAGPIAIIDAFEQCKGSGVVRSFSVKEFGSAQKLAFDVIFVGAEGHSIATNTVTAFDATIAAANFLQDTITVAAADYVDKGDYQEARFVLSSPLTVFNRTTVEGSQRELWFYLVARAVKTFTVDTRLILQFSIEND